MIRNLSELKREFLIRAQSSRLQVECAMDGTFFSDKVIIAEAPGDREVVQKLPLVGGSGSLLWRAVRKYLGLSRKDFYITNVSKRQVSTNKSDIRRTLNRNELALWTDLLRWELSCLPNVRYIIVMGNFALEAITGRTGITDWRGSVLDINLSNNVGGTRPVKVICCNNPAAVVREPLLETAFNMDIDRINRVMNGSHSPTQVSTILYPSVGEIDRFIDGRIKSTDLVGTDIETIGGETACIGFADSSTSAMCIAFRTKTDHVYTTREEMHIRRRIQEFYKSDTVRFVAQKGMFDTTWLWYKDKIHIPKIWFDTLLAHHVLYPPLPHNLGFLTSQYTDNPYYKNEKDEWREGGDIDEFWQYNGKDCAYIISIANKMTLELRKQGMEKFFFEHVMRLQPHLAEMTVGGVLIDREMKDALNEQLSETVGTLLHQFQNLCQRATGSDDIYYNPDSPKQMSDLYFSRLRLVGRGTSTDADNRERMFRHPRTSEPARQVLAAHGEYKTEQKFYSTYVKTEIDEDNRIRCEWNQTGVVKAPGRLSSSETLWGHIDPSTGKLIKHGTNLQNQPERAYPMFIADEGYGFAYFDMSQIEARIVAWEAKIESWIVQFERARVDGSYDAHRALASAMFKVPYDQVPSFDRYDTAKGHPPPEGKVDGDVTIRFVAKRCRHGLNYRMGPDRLATTTGLSIADADRAYRVYHRETPELRQWWADLEAELAREKALYNAYGRRYILMERKSPEALESIVAFKPQSTNGDKVCRVIYMSHNHPKWPKHVRVRLNVHDALVALGRLDELPMALSIMKFYAEEPIYIHGRELIVPAECKLSYPDEKGIHRWNQLKPITIESANTSSLSTG